MPCAHSRVIAPNPVVVSIAIREFHCVIVAGYNNGSCHFQEFLQCGDVRDVMP